MRTRLWIGICAGLFLLILGIAVSCCCAGNLDDDSIDLGITGDHNDDGTGGDDTGGDDTGGDDTGGDDTGGDDTGGDDTGGDDTGGDDTGGDDTGLVAAERYLPLDLDVEYVYRPTTVLDPFHYATDDVTYRTISATTGTGVAFERQDADKTSPVFDGLNFLGTELPDGSGWSDKWIDEEDRPGVILPETLTGIGQTWTFEQRYHQFEYMLEPGTWFPLATCEFELTAIEDVTVQGTAYTNCIRVDGDLDWAYGGYTEELALQIWYCPDVGMVQAECRSAGILVGKLELLSRT